MLDIDNLSMPEYANKSGIFLCTAGSLDVVAGNQIYRLHRGGLYVISPLLLVCQVAQSPDFKGLHILDELEVFFSVIHPIIDTILHLRLRDTPCIQLSEEDIAFVQTRKDLIDSKRQELSKACDSGEHTLLTAIVRLLEQETLLEVIHIYFRNRPVASQPLGRREAMVYAFIYSLHQNFKEHRDVAFYASEARLSTGYFTAIVKEKTGRSPFHWIVATTIGQAKLMLENTSMSIKEIASELRFPEQFTFRKYFKQYTGIPPKEWRKRSGATTSPHPSSATTSLPLSL